MALTREPGDAAGAPAWAPYRPHAAASVDQPDRVAHDPAGGGVADLRRIGVEARRGAALHPGLRRLVAQYAGVDRGGRARRDDPEVHLQRVRPPAVDEWEQVPLGTAYPGLVTALSADQRSTLVGAWQRRYSGAAGGSGSGATAVTVLLHRLLADGADHVDVEAWPTLFGVLRERGDDRLVAELLRNEMMRVFFTSLPVDREASVTVALEDPTRREGGPHRVSLVLDGTVLEHGGGRVRAADLASTYGVDLDAAIAAVSVEAAKVALAAALVDEVDAVTPALDSVTSRLAADPSGVALAEIRGLDRRIAADLDRAREYVDMPGWEAPEAAEVVASLEALAVRSTEGMAVMAAWRAENDPGRSLGEWNEETGTWLAGQALRHVEEGGVGGYVVGGLAYAGAFAVAFLDAGENVLTMGAHETFMEASRAYQAGDISGDELEEILWGASLRAILVAAVTRGVGAATSRIGAGVAARLGLQPLSLAAGAVRHGTAGAMTGPTALAVHDLTTRGLAGAHERGTPRVLLERGIPEPSDYLLAGGLGAGLGVLGGVVRTRALHRRMVGSLIDTPMGPMRVVAVTAQGAEVLSPLGGTAPIPGSGVGATRTVLVPQGWRPDALAVEAPPVAPAVSSHTGATAGLGPFTGPGALNLAGAGRGGPSLLGLGGVGGPTFPPGAGPLLTGPGAPATEGGLSWEEARRSLVSQHLEALRSGHQPSAVGLVEDYRRMLPERSSSTLPAGDWITSGLRGGPGWRDVPGLSLPYAGVNAWGYSAESWDLFRPAFGPPIDPAARLYQGIGADRGIVLDIPDQLRSLHTDPLTGPGAAARGYPMTTADMLDPLTGDVGARSHLDPHARSRPDVVTGGQSSHDPLNYVAHDRRYNEWVRRTLEGRLRGSSWQATEVTAASRRTVGGHPVVSEEFIVQLGDDGRPVRAWRLPTTAGFYDGMNDIDAIIGAADRPGTGAFEVPVSSVPATLRGGGPR